MHHVNSLLFNPVRASTTRLGKSGPSNACKRVRACLWALTGHPSNNVFHIRTLELSYLKSIQTHATTSMHTHRPATPSLLTKHDIGLPKFGMFGYGGDHPRMPLPFPTPLPSFSWKYRLKTQYGSSRICSLLELSLLSLSAFSSFGGSQAMARTA